MTVMCSLASHSPHIKDYTYWSGLLEMQPSEGHSNKRGLEQWDPREFRTILKSER